MLEQLTTFLDPWLVFLSDDPGLRLMQGAMILAGAIAIFLVFFATRDILLRTHSFFYMFVCIVLVAVLPVIGFLLYLLIRPSRTLAHRELEEKIDLLLRQKTPSTPAPAKPKPKKTKKASSKKEDISI